MARLTKTMRHQIISNLIKHGFKERREVLENAERIFADTVYNDLYSDDVKAKMEAMPKGFLPSKNYLYCTFGDQFGKVSFGKERIIAYKHHCGNAAKVYESNSLIAQRFFRLSDHWDTLIKEEAQAESTTQGILESVSTVEKLLEAWPECRPFVEGIAPVPKPLPPALPIPEINAMLGLKLDSEASERKG